MASPWPGTLPNPLIDSCDYRPQGNQIRSDVSAGVAKTRRHYTAVAEDVAITLPLTQAQWLILEAFVITTLKDVLPFEWSDFRRAIGGGNVRLYRFKTRPQWTPRGIGNRGFATLDLELLP